MNITKLRIFVVLFFGFSFSFYAQIKEFTPEKEAFFKELNEYLKSQKANDLDELTKELYEVWDAGNFGSNQYDLFYDNANLMLKKRANKSSFFKHFLEALISFHTKEQSQESFEAWLWRINKMLTAKSVNLSLVSVFFEETVSFLNDSALHKGNLVFWKYNGNRLFYSLSADSSKLLVEIDGNDISCITPRDTFIMQKVKAVYYPEAKKMVGESGEVVFPLAFENSTPSEVKFKTYTIDTKTDYVKIEHAFFHNDTLFGYDVEGVLELKTQENDIKFKTYPRFESYATNLRINNLIPNSIIIGRLYILGSTFAGKEGDHNFMQISKADKRIFKLNFGKYRNTPAKFVAENAEMTLYFSDDSIYHPNVEVNYLSKNQNFGIINSVNLMEAAPFIDNYHQVSINAEYLLWNINSDSICFSRLPGAGFNKVVFESTDFFSEYNLMANQPAEDQHPVFVLNRFYKQWGESYFTSRDFGRMSNTTVNDAKLIMGELAAKGYLLYNTFTDSALVLPKLHKTLKAKAKGADFDIIRFGSNTNRFVNNAVLDIKTGEMLIRGIPKLPVYQKIVENTFMRPDSVSVTKIDTFPINVFPANQQVIMQKNRTFKFGGRVIAADLEFIGDKFEFSYDNFYLKMDSIAELRVSLTDNDSTSTGSGERIGMMNYLENITGFLYIDKPDNKSSRINNLEFPILQTTDTANVYYDRKEVNKIAYPRDSVHFDADPFVVKNLFMLSGKTWELDGTFNSGGILPPIKTKLAVQTDTIKNNYELSEKYSFGFKYSIDSSGVEVYNGKAKLFSGVKASVDGIRGVGKFEYLTTEFTSDNMLFDLEQMTCTAEKLYTQATNDTIIVRKSGEKVIEEFPNVEGKLLDVKFNAKDDYLWAKTNAEDYKLFGNLAFSADTFNLKGSLKFSPLGLTGDGMLTFGFSKINSNLYNFKTDNFNAEAKEFTYKLPQHSENTFKASNLKVDINLQKRSGVFTSTGNQSNVEFPINDYKAEMDEFTWDMDNFVINLFAEKTTVKADSIVGRGNYIQIKDTPIEFQSKTGKYDFKKLALYANNVSFIPIADATIHPQDTVIINEGGVMDTLINATVFLGDSLHHFKNATVSVINRNKFNASGYYQYANNSIDTVPIYFEKLAQTSNPITKGLAIIPDSMLLNLSAYFKYKGRMEITGNKPEIAYKGFMQLNHLCDTLIPSDFFRVETEMTKDSIIVPINAEVCGTENAQLFAGLVQTKYSDELYGTFLSKRKNSTDKPIFLTDGYVYYDPKDFNYKFGNLDKIRNIQTQGNLIAFNRIGCVLRNFGTPDYKLDLGLVELTMPGRTNYNLNSKKIDATSILDINFHFPFTAFDIMARYYLEDISLAGVDYSTPNFKQNLIEYAGTDEALETLDNLVNKGEFRMPRAEKSSLVFSQLEMVWVDSVQALRSVGQIGLAYINGIAVHKLTDGYIEIVRKSSTHTVTIYLKLDDRNWFYFNYQAGQLFALSSDAEFNEILDTATDKSRRPKKAKNKEEYGFYTAKKANVTRFIDQFTGQ